MSVKGQGQIQKKKLNFTLCQFFVAWKKVSATPLILRNTLTVPIGYFIVLQGLKLVVVCRTTGTLGSSGPPGH